VYPRGLPVGVVESIAPDLDHQPYMAIRIKPAVDLDRVEEVLVITGMQAELTQAAQQDLADAAAQHAADLSAERLPGIHDDETPGAANGAVAATPPAANAPAVVPHPLPIVHPDRFTSGASPPASEMTPGAANSAPSSPSAPSSTQAQPQSGATK
jgi:rod shape-determining protein MreC